MKLHVTRYGGLEEDNKPPIIILHGLFGSYRNWHPIAKVLAKNNIVYALDMRNHGQSPHSEVMDYPSMSEDIVEFIDQISSTQISSTMKQKTVNIIAHSMGGKAALYLALKRPELINKLVIVDIAPIVYQHEFDDVLNAFHAIPLQKISSRQEADKILSTSIKQASLRQFLLQNLQFKAGQYQWRLNLRVIGDAISLITGFPDTSHLAAYEQRVLFVGGGESDYLNKANQALTRELFPLASFSMIKSAGHWLHAEQAELFLSLIESYMSRR